MRAQAGVAILFRKGLAITFHGDGKDKNGRVVWALVEINTKILLIIGVYAPPQGDNPDFFKDDVFPILDDVDYTTKLHSLITLLKRWWTSATSLGALFQRFS